ncbi:MAG: hypothetical protein WCK18_14765 [Prolixibacteraceae bacterium]
MFFSCHLYFGRSLFLCPVFVESTPLSVSGFVMEMTTEDSGGGKTLMTTVSLQTPEKYSVDLKNVKMGTSINKVNYFTF